MRRIAANIIVFLSGNSSFAEKEVMTSPVTIILNGPAQSEANLNAVERKAGSGTLHTPNNIPNTMEIVIGLISFFHELD